jgi:hypothetical protein
MKSFCCVSEGIVSFLGQASVGYAYEGLYNYYNQS